MIVRSIPDAELIEWTTYINGISMVLAKHRADFEAPLFPSRNQNF